MNKQTIEFHRDHNGSMNVVSLPRPPWGNLDFDSRESTRPDARITLLSKMSDREADRLYRREIRKHLIRGM